MVGRGYRSNLSISLQDIELYIISIPACCFACTLWASCYWHVTMKDHQTFKRQATTEGTACDHIVVWFDWRPCWCILYCIILWPLRWMLWLIDTNVDDTEVSKSVEYCALRFGKNGTPSKHRSDEHQQGTGSEFDMVSEAVIGKRDTALLLQI